MIDLDQASRPQKTPREYGEAVARYLCEQMISALEGGKADEKTAVVVSHDGKEIGGYMRSSFLKELERGYLALAGERWVVGAGLKLSIDPAPGGLAFVVDATRRVRVANDREPLAMDRMAPRKEPDWHGNDNQMGER